MNTLIRTLSALCLTLGLLAASFAAPPNFDGDTPKPAPMSQTETVKPIVLDAAGPRLHVISIADSDDSNIGVKVHEDARRFHVLFETSFLEAKKSRMLNARLIVGKETTSRNLLKAIHDLPVQPDDTVVVLYSGHGHTAADHHHTLNFGGAADTLRRDDLVKAMQKKNPRLAVLLTDACSGYPDNRQVRPSVPLHEMKELPKGDTMSWQTVQWLFLQHRGVVDITAAEPGFNARVERRNHGSYFVNAILQIASAPADALLSQLDADKDGSLQWDEVLPELRARAARSYQKENDDRPQQAFARSLGKWAPTTTTASR